MHPFATRYQYNSETDKVLYLYGDSYVDQVIRRELQRIALARLMFKKCSVILADEPTGSLDAGNAALVMDLLHEMNDAGKTVIMVTHNEEIVNQAKFSIEI